MVGCYGQFLVLGCVYNVLLKRFIMSYTILTIISAILLLGFIILGVRKFGLLYSYSDYAAKWEKAVDLKGLNLWSIVTLVAAFLLVPVMVGVGVGSALQFLGFFAPVYLMFVALTPEWATDDTQFIYHVIFTCICAACGILWSIFVAHTYILMLIVAGVALAVSLFTKTLKEDYVFWGEMAMFLTVYISLLTILL